MICNLRSVKRRSFQNLGDEQCDLDYIYFIAEDIHLIASIQCNIEKMRYLAWC